MRISSETATTRNHRRRFRRLWTPLSGVESLPPSQFSFRTTNHRAAGVCECFERRDDVLLTDEGTTLQSIIDACVQGRINGHVVVVISKNSGSGAFQRAAAAGIETFHLPSVTHASGNSLDAAICGTLQRSRADVIFLAGYMKRLGSRTLAAFRKRILNTHPALLPKFGAQGMFGDRVFEAILAAGESESGASVHLVDAEYDTGAVVRRECVRVLPGDTVESLKTRVQACKREVVVKTLAAMASGELPFGEG